MSNLDQLLADLETKAQFSKGLGDDYLAPVNGSTLLRLLATVRRYREAMELSARQLDEIKFELNASVYTLEDDEFETTFYIRDVLLKALKDEP